MKKLIVPKITRLNDLDNQLPQLIDISSWENYTKEPIVKFNIAHDNTNIYLKYTVQEPTIVAKTLENNGRVWEDSCVEFFIAPENDGIYYNFEFNCIGAKLLAAGTSRHNRAFANAAILDKIIVESSLEKQVFEEKIGDFNWELKAIIPIKSFFKHKIRTLNGKICRANFYKCGDGLTTPHYLSWQYIETEKPDFHTPQYFGEIVFETVQRTTECYSVV